MMKSIINLYKESLKVIEKGIPISRVKETGLFEEYINLKFNIEDEKLYKFESYDSKVKEIMKNLIEEYKSIGTPSFDSK